MENEKDKNQIVENSEIIKNPIEEARLILEELKKENQKKEELLLKEQELIAKRILGGGTEVLNNQKKEETNHEYRLRIERELRDGKKEFN